jgi:hypothetical protein
MKRAQTHDQTCMPAESWAMQMKWTFSRVRRMTMRFDSFSTDCTSRDRML